MTIGVSIVHFGIKVPKLVQMIVTTYRLQTFKVPIVNLRWPPKIQDLDIFASWYLDIDAPMTKCEKCGKKNE